MAIFSPKIISRKLLFFTFILGFFICTNAFAQDINFSQSFSNPLLLNPAYAGSLGYSRLNTGFSGQWRNRALNYSQTAISYDQYFPKLHSGFGVGYTYQDSHYEIYNNVDIYYSFNFNINKNFQIRPAINIGIGKSWLDVYTFFPIVRPSKATTSYPNMGAGLLMRLKNFIIGASYNHITEPNYRGSFTLDRLPSKLYIHLSYMFYVNGKAFLTPGIIYTKQKDREEMDYSLLMKFWKVKLGAGYRQNFYNADSFTGMIGFCSKQLSIGYSYGLVVSKLSNKAEGPHEISAVFKFNCKNDKEKYRISQLDGF